MSAVFTMCSSKQTYVSLHGYFNSSMFYWGVSPIQPVSGLVPVELNHHNCPPTAK